MTVYLVLESTQDFSRTTRFDANAMHGIGGFDERALLGKIAKALDASRGMGKEETRRWNRALPCKRWLSSGWC